MATMATLPQNKPIKEIYGLEVPNHLTYQGWEPGGTYTKSLILKNVKLKTQKIKFRIESKNFFCELYPHPVVLSAGNSCTLPVTFRPKEKNEITENVEISTSDGHFTVPLVAVLPKAKLMLPSSIQLGLCEVQNEINVSFNITNSGSISTPFQWECNLPFEISPISGTLPPKGSLKLEASFKPPMASIFKSKATCHYGDQYSRTDTVSLEGTGKYPHLLVKESSSISNNGGDLELQFGEVPLCTSIEKSVDLINISPVPASFRITPETDSHTQDSMFRFLKTHGTVPPLGNLTIKIICSPSFSDQYVISHFALDVKGGLSKTTITCTAQPTSPRVVSDKDCISFGSIGCSTSSIACLNLTNLSKTSSVYQFQIDPASVFVVDNPSGIIKGRATVSLRITFNPSKPLPYHRPVVCLVLNQDPIIVHLFGSAYSEIIKPAQILQQHILLYKSLASTGLSKLPPQYLLECIENGSLTVTSDGLLTPDKIFHPPLDKLAPPTTDSTAMMPNYFKQGSDMYASHHFMLESDDMRFGFISPRRSSEGKILTVTNLTQGTVICSWMIGNDDVFRIVPNERELLPQSTGAFAVSFWPKESNNLFCKELECYIFYKSLWDRTIVDSRVLIPPWCLTVTASGHSFSSGVEPFQANVFFNNKKLVLPDTLPERPSYRSFVIQSNCDTPTLYDFESNNNNQVFCLKPGYGIIQGRSCQIVTAQFLPPKSQQYDQSVNCVFNNYPKFTKFLHVTGVSESPRLILDKEESMFFKPTCVGGSSQTQITITNPCGLSVRFAWLIKGPVSKCLKITPRAGVLQPNERLSVSFLFTPLEVKRYHFATVASSLLLNDDSVDSQKYRVPLCIYGEGTTGTIECLNPEIDCGHIAIGASSKVAVNLRNTSSCTLRIKLGATQIIETPDQQREEVTPGQALHGLEFGFIECEIEPFTHLSVPVTLRPSKTAKYLSNIFYVLISENEVYHNLCSITVHGAYPSLSIIDVQGDGIANSLSKSQIWSMLQLSSINQHLCEDPSPAELRYTISTRHSISRRVPVLTCAIQDFNFCPGPLSDETHSTYYLIIANSGQIEAEWVFKFPMDMYMEPEFWAESGRLDPIEQHELDVVKNSLFSIEPKEGKLSPGKKMLLKLSFVHSNLGTNKLPVLLKIDKGREIMLNFIGVTSSPDTPCIIFKSTTHTFAPMPVNTLSYPIQVLEIYNASDVEGNYTIDTLPLDEMRECNYDNNIMNCLSPSGSLPPRQTTKIEFIFSPLEAKVYTVDLAFHLSDGDTRIVTLVGEGIQNDCRSVTRADTIDDIPLTSTLTLSWQLAQLSQDKLVLGGMPLFAVVQRIVFMRNTSDSTISYKWDLEYNKIVSIYPSSGYIQPGKSVQLRVTFHSESYPTLYNMDLMCFVTNESEVKVYQKKLKQCESLVAKRSDEFIITDKKSFTQQINTKEDTYEEWMKKDLSKKSKARSRKRKSEPTIVPPIAPKPRIMHLSVTGNTYSIPDYCRLYGSKFDSFCIDYNSIMTKTRPVEKQTIVDGELKLIVSDSEMSIITNTMAECLRDLEKDTNFLLSLRSIANARIPYFTQFTTSPFSSAAGEQDASIKENATRHVYADGLQQNLSLVESTGQEGSASIEGSECRNSNIDEGSGVSIGLPKPPPPITTMEVADVVGTKIKRTVEFQSFTKLVLENVLLNVIKEVNKGEVSLTAPVYTIAKPPS